MLFAGKFPVGQEMEYPIVADARIARHRLTDEEKKGMRAMEEVHEQMYQEARLAAEAHRQVGTWFLAFENFHNKYCLHTNVGRNFWGWWCFLDEEEVHDQINVPRSTILKTSPILSLALLFSC